MSMPIHRINPSTFYALVGNSLSRRTSVSRWMVQRHRFNIRSIGELRANTELIERPKTFQERIICPDVANERDIELLRRFHFHFVLIPAEVGECPEVTARFYKCLEYKLNCLDHELLYSF